MTPTERVAALAGAARQVLLPDVLVAEDLARALHVGPGAARAMLRSGAIPARKIGRRWLIARTELLRSLAAPDVTSRFGLLPRPGKPMA